MRPGIVHYTNNMSEQQYQYQTVILAVADAQGYSPRQVRNTMTLYDLQCALEDAIERFGPDARIVTDNGDRYGATFGGIDPYRDTFISADRCEECGENDAIVDEDGSVLCESCRWMITEGASM